MYNSLKGKNLVRVGGQRRCLKFVPAQSGRKDSLPSTDEGELNAITRAVKHGEPLFFIRSSDGTTLDVVLDKTVALRERDLIRDRIHSNSPQIDAYERRATALIRL